MYRCDIIIPVWNQLEPTRKCLESILRNTHIFYNLIIIDNGSDKETEDYLRDLKRGNLPRNISIIRNEKNKGFIKAVNQGIRASGERHLCILNNDTVVTDGWLSELAKVAESDPKIGIVNPSSNNLGQKLKNDQSIDDYAKSIEKDTGKYAELMNCLGFCMFIKKSLIEEIGLFDEVYGMGNFEDTDFSMRAKQKGYLCVRAIASYVHHRENTSFNAFRRYRSEFAKNRKIFESRWGVQKRILFIVDDITQKCNSLIKQELQNNNWIYLAAKHKIDRFDTAYPGITILIYNNAFYANLLLKILFKKKKFDYIYCDNNAFLKVLFAFRPLYRAEIIRLYA